jgi:chromosome segregation ATPase
METENNMFRIALSVYDGIRQMVRDQERTEVDLRSSLRREEVLESRVEHLTGEIERLNAALTKSQCERNIWEAQWHELKEQTSEFDRYGEKIETTLRADIRRLSDAKSNAIARAERAELRNEKLENDLGEVVQALESARTRVHELEVFLGYEKKRK